MKNITLILLFTLIAPLTTNLMGQSIDAAQNKTHIKAINHYERGNYDNAEELYLELINKAPQSFTYNYELALLYFHELNNKKASIPYFKTAIRHMKDTIIDIFNYLGQAYHSEHELDKAIEQYQIYSAIPPKPDVIKISMKRYIQRCIEEKEKNRRIEQQRNTVSDLGIQVINAGTVVNSEFNDFAPIQLNPETIIYTTARKFDYQFEVYVNKPYLATKDKKGVYNSIEDLINTKYSKIVFDPDWHLIVSDFTKDLSHIVYIYENNIYIKEGGLEGGNEPIKITKDTFVKEYASATISPDGLRIIYSAYDRNTKNWNLYHTTRSNTGEWSQGAKLELLSTNGNEKYPALSEDGYTLYFSSTGHNSSGGYDIFKSTLQPSKEWSAPERMPEPINSPQDDIWYTPQIYGNKAFLSSDRPGGYGQLDIYEVVY